ncbi:hypothetical protein M1D51_11835 [Arthrobacter sp. R3-55]
MTQPSTLRYANVEYSLVCDVTGSFAVGPCMWPDGSIAQQAAAQLPWGHIMVLLDEKLGSEATNAYAAAALQYGWSRNVLLGA